MPPTPSNFTVLRPDGRGARGADRDAAAAQGGHETVSSPAAAGAVIRDPSEQTPHPFILDEEQLEQALAAGELVHLGQLEEMDAAELRELLQEQLDNANDLLRQGMEEKERADALERDNEDLRKQLVCAGAADAVAASLAHKKEAAEAKDLLQQARQVQSMMKQKLLTKKTENEQQEKRVFEAEKLLRQSADQLAASVEKVKTEEEARKWAEGESEGLRVTVRDLRKTYKEAVKLVEKAQQEGEKSKEKDNATIKDLRQELHKAQEKKNQSVAQTKQERIARMEAQKAAEAAKKETADAKHALKQAEESVDALAGECLKFDVARQEMEAALEKAQQEIAALQRRPTAPSGLECVICLCKPPTTVHLPCGHLILCDECAKAPAASPPDNACPVCRQAFVPGEVQRLLKIYN